MPPERRAKREKLTPSMEDYLEAVFVLVRDDRVARVRDIARRVGVHAPAVTAAMKSLARRGLLHYEAYQFVTLTDRGRQAAAEIDRRHRVLRRFLSDVLGLRASAAEPVACRMEHAVDADVMGRIERLVSFVEDAGEAPLDDWAARLRRHCAGARRKPGPAGAKARARRGAKP